jgi:large subunit ribosomal protein L15
MQIHNVKRKTKNKKPARVGRGGKRGKTSGRGTKGQLARSGRKLRPELRDIIKKLPKMRGRGKNSFLSIQEKPYIINLRDLELNFKKGEKVNPSSIVSKGIFKQRKGKNPVIKILAAGEITKELVISRCIISEGAKEKILNAGGKIENQ